MTTTDPTHTPDHTAHRQQPPNLTPAQLIELTELLTQERAALSIPPPEGDVDLADDPGARLAAREAQEALNGLQAAQLEKIDHALARIEDGTYGSCESCGEAIPAARLEVMPSATLCVDCQASSRG